ncbi:SpoIIE family protein phosphatase [Streptomyces sp. TR06-5]|uniref:ATP-binding SpoIIE family protein phosphatase n=1 Tax=unclassified Streptomyces TaxID=2593676 RepID=UPI0039A06FEB
MRTDNVLGAVGTGVWQWDGASQTVTMDARAAELLGIDAGTDGAGTVAVHASAVRGRVHPVDFVQIKGMATLALTEGTATEAVVRVMASDGTPERTVRMRLRSLAADPVLPAPGRPGTTDAAEALPSGALHAVGTISEVPEACGESDGRAESGGGRVPQSAQQDVGDTAEAVGSLDRRRAREAFLLDAGRALAEARTTAEVLRVTAALSMPGFTPAGLAVFGVENDRLSIVGQHGHAPGSEKSFLDMPLDTAYPAAEAVRTGRAIYLPDPDAYRSRFPATWPLAARFGRKSWAFLPLVAGGRTIGAWMASFAYPVRFTPDERSVLSTVARMLGQALSRASLRETEQKLADDLQRIMRPADRPAIEGLQVAARYVPTGGGLQVGGDWYDVITLPSGRTAVVIGDVQGHDVRSAGIMAQLRIALRAYAAEGHHPDGVLSRASRFLDGLNRAGSGEPGGEEERFATCLYAEVDAATGTLDVARAGHPNPAVRLPDATLLARHTAGGLPLGVAPDTDYPITRLVLQPGETLLLCTDGLIETGGHDLRSGWERLARVVAEHPEPDGGLEGLADSVLQSVHGPRSHHTVGPLADRRDDDIALVMLAREGDPLGPDASVAPPVRRTVLTVAQAEPDRIADARHQLGGLLHDWKDPAQADGAVLMLSEMLTNVLLHTDGDAMMMAEISGERGSRLLQVEITDGSDELPHRRSPGEMASSGRGLLLLDTLADAWGVEPRGDGKCTWFQLRESGTSLGFTGGLPLVGGLP